MKKAGFTLLLALVSLLSTFGQKLYTEEEGKVTQNELSMMQYDKDPDAEALVIYNFGEYSFRESPDRKLKLNMTIRRKIKILKQAGIKYADFEIPFYVDGNDSEDVKYITATTYNLVDGELVKTQLDPKKIFEEKIDDSYRSKKFALPDVREGSVIEISYTLITPYFQNMRPWYFQDKIPVIHSKLEYNAIPYYEYAYIAKGVSDLDEFDSKVSILETSYGPYRYKEVKYTFGLFDLPAFKDEEFVSSVNDYIASIYFQLAKINYPDGGHKQIMSTWPEISQSLLDNDAFGKYIKNAEKEASKVIPTLGLEGKSLNQKMEIINQYVKDNYKWDGYNSKYANDKLSDFLKKKTGNAANLNLYLLGLLKSAKLDAFPIVLSTRRNGAIKQEYPFIQFFNYVIVGVQLDDRVYLLDATEPLLHYTNLPEQCINVLGLIVAPKQKEDEWVITKQQSKMMASENFKIEIEPDKQIMNVGATFMANGNEAFRLRKEYAGADENLVKYYKKKNNIDISNLKVVNYEKTNTPFVIDFSFGTGIESNDNKLFIQPFCNLSLKSNPFKQTSRSLPVDLIYLIGESYTSRISVPDGYKVEYLPSELTIDNDIMKFTYTVAVDGDLVNVESSYTLRQNIYDANQYDELKASFTKMINQLSEMVIFEKK